MHTPAGKECRFFYGDYYRGRNNEECRLLSQASPSLLWKADLCKTCPMPEIFMANACQNLDFIPSLHRPFPFIQERVKVLAVCRKKGLSGFDPHIGCGNCHPLPDIFTQIKES
jgi:hypothetical protein